MVRVVYDALCVCLSLSSLWLRVYDVICMRLHYVCGEPFCV